MKILFVIASLRNGGAERVLKNLADEFCKKHIIKIAFLESNENRYKFDARVELIDLNSHKKGVKFEKYSILRSLFKSQNPDIIISFMDWTNVACIIANFGLKYKLIATEHNEHNYLKSRFFTFVRDFCYRFCDGLSVLSRSDLEYYKKFNQNCVVMYNPCGERVISKDEFDKKENIILSIGRLEAVKGYEMYLKALLSLDKELLKHWQVVIAGGGSLRDLLVKTADDYGLDIKFLGHVEDVAKLYKSAKIFTICSTSEGLSNVLIESAFHGCARLSTDTVGAKELIKDGFNGILSPVGDDVAFGKNLTKLLKQSLLREALATNATLNLDDFRSENIVKKWEEFIKSALVKS